MGSPLAQDPEIDSVSVVAKKMSRNLNVLVARETEKKMYCRDDASLEDLNKTLVNLKSKINKKKIKRNTMIELIEIEYQN